MNTFINKGNIADVMSFIEQDLNDTYNNQLNILDTFYDMEESNSAFDHVPFFLNDTQYNCSKAADSRIIDVYLNDTNGTKVASIDMDSIENDGPWASFDALQADVSDAADCTYSMITAMRTVDVDDLGGSVLTKFSSSMATWISRAGAMAKETYACLIDALATGADSGATIVNWILGQYRSIVNATGDNDTGGLEFHDTNYHVQGFAGSYALQVGFTVISTVLTTVITVIQPIIGIIVGGIAAGVRALFGLIPDKNDTYATENNVANNIFAVPVFQGEIAKSYLGVFLEGSNPDNTNYVNRLLANRSCTIRLAGWLINLYLKEDNDTLQYEAFVTGDFMGYPSSALYSFGSSPSTAYTDSNPYINYITAQVLAGRSLLPTDKPTYDVLCDLIFMETQCISPSGYAAFTSQVNQDFDATDAFSVDDLKSYGNNAMKASVCLALMTFIWRAAIGDISVIAPTPTNTIPNVTGSTQDWLNYFAGCISMNGWPSWSQIVNTIIPRLRVKYNSAAGFYSGISVLSGIGQLYRTVMTDPTWSNSDYPYQYTDGIYRLNKFRWIPPKYSENARATTIALAIATAVAITAAVVTKVRIKQKMRNKQIKRYRDVQTKWNQYMETGSDEDLKEYRKSIKKYNRWSSVCGTSRLSGISGWEAGSDSSTPSAPASFNGYLNNDKYAQTNVDTPSIDVSTITKLISGV